MSPSFELAAECLPFICLHGGKPLTASYHPQFISNEANDVTNTPFISCHPTLLRYSEQEVRLRWQVVKEGLIPMALSKIWKENTASIFGNYL